MREYLNIVDKAGKAHAEAVTFLNELDYHAEVDEIAIWIPNAEDLMRAILDEVQTGETIYFNASTDRVKTMPFYGEYDVAYHFLQTHGLPYRIEAMVMGGSGISYAHDALARRAKAKVFPVHASWKCGDEADYAEEENFLRGAGFWLVQDCRSSYGHFSYWTHPDLPSLYFKPRVNLRDRAEEIRDGSGNLITTVQA